MKNLCHLSLQVQFWIEWRKKTKINQVALVHLEKSHINRGVGDGGSALTLLIRVCGSMISIMLVSALSSTLCIATCSAENASINNNLCVSLFSNGTKC